MKIIDCWWPTRPLPGNVGDIITPFLLKKIFNIHCNFVNTSNTKTHLMGSGSIINLSKEASVIWGSGAMSKKAKVNESAKVLTVRGPITKKIVEQHNQTVIHDVLCDPGLLAPYAYNPHGIKKRFDYGIIPHYVDYEHVKKTFQNTKGIKIINVLNAHPEKVLHQIMQCRNTISSSLHGLIFSHAYGIPTTWIKLSNKLCGDGTKFKDYFLSVGIKNPICHDLTYGGAIIDPEAFSYIMVDKYPDLDRFIEFSHEELYKL